MTRKGTKATNKNVHADDILRDVGGGEFIVWEEPSDWTNGLTMLRQYDGNKFKVQTTARLGEHSYWHTGKQWVEPPPDAPVVATEAEMLAAKHGWLAPNGAFYACQSTGHNALSHRLCYHLKLREEPEFDGRHFGNDNERALELAGWIKVSQTMWFERQDTKPPSQRQRDVVLQWHQVNTQELPYWMVEEEEGFSLL
jgi:hypothetical protein